LIFRVLDLFPAVGHSTIDSGARNNWTISRWQLSNVDTTSNDWQPDGFGVHY
jgi:hypothetical protein